MAAAKRAAALKEDSAAQAVAATAVAAVVVADWVAGRAEVATEAVETAPWPHGWQALEGRWS